MTKIEPRFISKDYEGPFELDSNKLNRISAILEDAFDSPILEINVTLQDGKNETLHSFEALLSHDNTEQNPITTVRITIPPSEGSHFQPAVLRFHGGGFTPRSLSIHSEDPRKAAQTFAALEEQFQRMSNNSWIFRLQSFDWSYLIAFGFLALMGVAIYLGVTYESTKRGITDLSETEVRDLLTKAEQADSVDAKLDVLLALEKKDLQRVQAAHQWNTAPSGLLNSRTAFLILPPLLIIGVILFAVRKLYPPYVFNWGDYQSKYGRLLAWRDRVWTGVVLAFALNIAASVFFLGIIR